MELLTIWTSITKKRYIQIVNTELNGIVSVLYIDDVSNVSRWEYPDKTITVCEAGMKWLEILPYDENYLITAMLNSDDVIDVWYIDIFAGYGFDSDQVAYYDDLYLDLIVRPNGDIKIDDMDELEDAFANKIITKELFDLALLTQAKLENGILRNISKLNNDCMKLFNVMNTLNNT